jgi:hypothetical protein
MMGRVALVLVLWVVVAFVLTVVVGRWMARVEAVGR